MIDNASLVMRRQKVEVREHLDSQITIKSKGRYLDFHEVYEVKPVKITKAKKSPSEAKKKKGKYIPPSDHPWRRYYPSLHHNSYLKRV